MGSCAEPNPSQSLQADLGSGVIGVAYERRLMPELSLRASFQLNRPWYTDELGGTETDVAGFGLELRPVIFPWGTGLEGVYVSPFGRLAGIRGQDELEEAETGVGFSAGLTAGYGWLLHYKRVLVRVGAGAQYWAFDLSRGGQRAGLTGLYPDVDLIVGWAF